MGRAISLLIAAVLAVGVAGCTITTTSPGYVTQDGSVYLGFVLASRKKVDKDWMLVGTEHGHFSSLRFRIEDRPYRLDKLVVTFADGERWTAPLEQEFAAESWSPEIQLPGQRAIHKVSFFGKAGGKKGLMAKLSLYGRR
ncbi:MAG: hypothetical protein JRI23_34770 [Deltaproteobacteria bacterium]|jgi:hypothetical protein|nr:hypothetical protein [Deltaproteobacteria bacterium]MBW2537471.1 hypothetical protein [Deltaproteobacteria bacterium]